MKAEDTSDENPHGSICAEDTRMISVFDMKYLSEHGHSRDNPLTGLGSGDCALFLNVLPENIANEIFDTMDAEIDWYY